MRAGSSRPTITTSAEERAQLAAPSAPRYSRATASRICSATRATRAGFSLRDGRVVEGTFPALVSVATWEACEKVRSTQRFKTQNVWTTGKIGSSYLLSGLLRCAECESTMSGFTRPADRTHPEPRRPHCCI
jgi:hypothetical protein